MTDRSLNVGIGIKAVDTSGVTAVANLAENIDQAADSVEKAKKQGGLAGIIGQNEEKRVTGLVNEIVRLQSELNKTEAALNQIDTSDSNFTVLTRQADELRESIIRANAEIGKTPQRLSSGVDVSQRGESALMAGAGLLSGLGAGGAAQGLQLGGDVLGVIGPLKELGGTLTETGGIVGRVASAGATLLAPLGGIAAGLGAVLAVVAPVAGLAAAAAAGLAAFNAGLDESAKRLQGAAQANQQLFELLGSGATTEDAINARLEAERRLAASQEELATIENAFASGFESTANQRGDAAARLLYGIGQLTGADDELTKRADELRASIEADQQFVERLTGAIDENAFASGEAAAHTEELNAAITRLAAIEQQRAQMIDQFDQQQSEQLEDRLRRDEHEQRDADIQAERRLKGHKDRITAIETEGQSRVLAIHEAGLARIAAFDSQTGKLQTQLNDTASKLRDDRAKVDKDYMQSERAAFKKFTEEQARLGAEADKARLRKLEDINNQLLEAEEANDVVRFIQAKRAGDLEIKRMGEDADDATKLRIRQFEQEREAAEQAREARLAELQETAVARRADIQAQIEERAAERENIIAEINAQAEAEAQRIKNTIIAQQKAFDDNEKLLEEDRKRRNKDREEDEKIADDRRKKILDQAIADLDTRAAKERAVIEGTGSTLQSTFTGVLNAISSAASQAIARVQAMAAASLSGSSSSGLSAKLGSLGGGSTPRLTAFANEGLVTAASGPTLALLGERLKPGEVEAVMRLNPRQSAGLPGGLRGGTLVNFNFGPMTFGAELTYADVEGAVMEMGAAIVQGLSNARSSTGSGAEITIE